MNIKKTFKSNMVMVMSQNLKLKKGNIRPADQKHPLDYNFLALDNPF